MALAADDKVWTYADLPDDGRRYEIVDGRLYVDPSPSTAHQTVSKRLKYLLYALEQQGKGFVFNAPYDVFMPGADPVEPDLVFLSPGQRSLIQPNGVHGAPCLLVEILSPSTAARDRVVKLRKYAQCGVPHYWVVDPLAGTIEAFTLQPGGHYLLAVAAGRGETFTSPAVPEISFEMDEIFGNIPGIDDPPAD